MHMADYYSEIAEGYDELHSAEQEKKLHDFLARVALRHNLTLLDVGCGTGRSAKLLSFYDLQWHGIDPSDGLLAQADSEIRARIRKASAEDIPWPDASFDIIISLTALQNFIHPAKGTQEMKRVAKPGALLLISFLKKSQKHEELNRLLHEHLIVKEQWEQEQDMMYICENK
jgi:ubiquinone/menaquinone biosynthesis C-methylase UbiE